MHPLLEMMIRSEERLTDAKDLGLSPEHQKIATEIIDMELKMNTVYRALKNCQLHSLITKRIKNKVIKEN